MAKADDITVNLTVTMNGVPAIDCPVVVDSGQVLVLRCLRPISLEQYTYLRARMERACDTLGIRFLLLPDMIEVARATDEGTDHEAGS